MLNAKTLSLRPLFAAATLVLAMSVLPQRAHASYTVLIDFGADVPMTSTVKGYEKVGRCLSFSFASARDTGGNAGGGGEFPAPTHTEITIARLLDAASPKIWQRVLTANDIPLVKITLVSDAGLKLTEIELKNVFVTSYSVSGSSGGDDMPYEQFALTYQEIKYSVFPTTKDGKAGTPSTYTWNVTENYKP
jgi:type VI secretion system secreted protein Hcp